MDVKKHGAAALARVLKVLVSVTFVCNLIVLPCVPMLTTTGGAADIVELWGQIGPYLFLLGWQLFGTVPYLTVLSLFLLFCGVCTAVILWQARRVLITIIEGDTFTLGNARNMRRAAVCCFLICAAALARVVWSFFYYASPAPLFTYNALFVPLFLMGGLLCMVMSALFRQAAELKEENDLTI